MGAEWAAFEWGGLEWAQDIGPVLVPIRATVADSRAFAVTSAKRLFTRDAGSRDFVVAPSDRVFTRAAVGEVHVVSGEDRG